MIQSKFKQYGKIISPNVVNVNDVNNNTDPNIGPSAQKEQAEAKQHRVVMLKTQMASYNSNVIQRAKEVAGQYDEVTSFKD